MHRITSWAEVRLSTVEITAWTVQQRAQSILSTLDSSAVRASIA